MRKSEQKKAIAIKQDKSNGKNIFKYINMLRGEKEKEKTALDDSIYGNDDKKLNKNRVKSEIETYWKGIYCKHENNIREVWNNDIREEYVNGRNNIKLELEMGRNYKVLESE